MSRESLRTLSTMRIAILAKEKQNYQLPTETCQLDRRDKTVTIPTLPEIYFVHTYVRDTTNLILFYDTHLK